MAGILDTVGDERRRNAHILALLDAAHAAFGADTRQQGSARLLRHRICGPDTRRGDRDVGRPRQALGDQCVELRVAKVLPPAFGRPHALRAGKGGMRFKRFGRSGRGLGAKVGHGGAAREQAQNSGGEKNRSGHGFQRY